MLFFSRGVNVYVSAHAWKDHKAALKRLSLNVLGYASWPKGLGPAEGWLDYSSESEPGEGGRAPDADAGLQHPHSPQTALNL